MSYVHAFSCRFTAEERAKRPQLAHMPFGLGPHNCIGMRFALMEAKVAFIEILRHYTLLRSPDTEVRRNIFIHQNTNVALMYPRYPSRSLMEPLTIQRMVFILE